MNALMRDKVCLVTGATRGLGRETALGLARMGAIVVIVGRDPDAINLTVASLRSTASNPCVEGLVADLSSQADVRRLAETFLSRYTRLDILINNVGGTFLKNRVSFDGYEMTWALNYLNHFLLINLLLDTLKATAASYGEARIIELTSSIYRLSSPHFDKLPQGNPIQGVLAYAKSKRAMIVLAGELSRRLTGTGVTINAITPGFVKTGISRGNGFLAGLAMKIVHLFSIPVEAGVRPILNLATSPDLCGKSGKYYYQFKEMPDDPTCLSQEEGRRLWSLSERMLI